MNNFRLFVTIFFVIIIFVSQAQIYREVIDDYVNLIIRAFQNGFTYRLPVDAYEYYSNDEMKNYGTYDFVIVGAGAAGSVIANRLSEIKLWNVLVLEAGDYGSVISDIPNMFYPIQFTDYNWGFNSTPQTTACLGMVNRMCGYPRGKGVGGSTLINGLVYSRGHKSDFDRWAKLVGNERWNYQNVLNYFKKSENFVHRDPEAPVEPEFHGKNGYLRVEYHLPRSPQLDAFLRAHREIGLDVVDYNANRLGGSQSQLNTIEGRRLDNAKAFLYPVRNRPNLKILPRSYVTKIKIDSSTYPPKATGVEFSHDGDNYVVNARYEVILSAGAFGSPHILMLSGIGPRNHLENVGIRVVSDLEVGSTLRDNPTFYGINFVTNYTEPVRSLESYVLEYLRGFGPFAVPSSNQGVGFYESSYTKGTGIPDIEFMFIPANATSILSQRSFGLTDQTYEDTWKYISVPQTFLVYIIALHSESVGTVRLRNRDPYEYPVINSNFLSDPENKDINTLYEGIQLVFKMMQTQAFRSLDTRLQGGPLTACRQHLYLSRNYWFCALRQLTVNVYHPLGTCPMGKDPRTGAVVDPELKVFGVENLRVADASVFPFTLAGHPTAPTTMVGEQLADIVKSLYLSRNIDFSTYFRDPNLFDLRFWTKK